MARIILLQCMVALAVALIALLLGGQAAGVSSLLAGMSCVIPNIVFAYGLRLSDQKAHRPGSFYVWELIKVLLTIALMVAIFWLYEDVRWLAFLLSFVVVLKSYLFLLLKSRN